MGMPSAHLRDQVVRHIVRRELPGLEAEHELPREVEHEVGHFLADRDRVAGSQCGGKFMRFLNQIRAQGLASLDAVPCAALAQVCHHRHGAIER